MSLYIITFTRFSRDAQREKVLIEAKDGAQAMSKFDRENPQHHSISYSNEPATADDIQSIPLYENANLNTTTPRPIQDNLREFLSDPERVITNVGGRFTVYDFNNLTRVMSNPEEDFLIFDNGGAMRFEIKFDRTVNDTFYPVKDFIEYLLREHKSWIYSYQINKTQTILKEIR